MLSCREVSRLVSESMDRDLPLMRRMGLRFHFMMCKYCVTFSRQIKSLRDLAGGFADKIGEAEDVNIKLRPEAREKIRQAMKDNRA